MNERIRLAVEQWQSGRNGQFKLLTLGRLGMRLKEFRYYQPPGGFYGNPYDKDFAQERQKERRNGLIKAGIVGAGLLGGGALLGRGLYKVGKSGAVRRAEDLAEELTNLRATKSAANVAEVTPAPRGRPAKTKNNTPPPAPPQTTAPTPPPQTPPPQTPPPTPPTGKKTTPKKVVENLNQSGDLPAGAAAAEIEEIKAATGEAPKPRKLTARQQKLANRQAKVAKFAAAQSGGTASVPSTPAPAAPVAVVPKTAPVAAKIETPTAKTTKKVQGASGLFVEVPSDFVFQKHTGKWVKPTIKKPQTLPTKPAASATNEELVEIAGVGKFPFTGTPEQTAAFRKRLEETTAAGGFKGKSAGDVVDEIRQSLKPKSDFPEGLSDKLRAAGKENNPKAKKKSKAKKQDADEADDLDDLDEAGDINEPDASPDEADWEAKLKENPQVRAKKSAAKPDSKKPAAKAAAKPAAKSKKGKKEAAPLSFAERIAAKVKAKRDKKNGKNLSALLHRVRYFNQFQTDEGGIPFTGKVAKDRFIKKLRDEDLDRRDANLLRAGGAGALAGLLLKAPLSAGKRALIGAGVGSLGVLGTRMATDNTRDIYGERSRGAKRAEFAPVLAGLGAAGYFASRRLRGLAARLRGVKEFGSSGLGRLYRKKASLLKKGGFIERRNPDAPVLQPGAIWPGSFIETPSFVARGNVNMKTGQVYSNQMLPSDQQKYAGIYHRIASKGKPRFIDGIEVPEHSVPGEFTGKFRQRKIHNDWLYRHDKNMRGFSARLRGMKHFDDYRLYYFKGRNTGIAARSAEEARSKKKRGGDELVAVRTPSDSEKSQMARGVWVRTRRDGKSPGQSRYGKGRGQGPARKSLSAKLRGLKEFGVLKSKIVPVIGRGIDSITDYDPFGHFARRTAKLHTQWAKGWRAKESAWGTRFVPIIGKYSPDFHNTKEYIKVAKDNRKQASDRFKRDAVISGAGLTAAGAGAGYLATRKKEQKQLAEKIRGVRFFQEKKTGMNPYVGAALSGFGSGAALGSLALLRRGATFRGAAKTAGKLGLASAGIVGGGALLGSKIVGDPRKEESAPFMKRAAIGGTLVGAGAGLGGALLLRRTSGGARALVAASKKSEPFSRPAMWLRKAPLAGAAGIGAVGGALYGGGMGLDEGQQVDSIRNLRKDMKNFSVGSFPFSGKRLREFSARLRFFGRGDQARWDARRGGGVGANEDSQFANTSWGWATDRPMYVPKRDGSGRILRDKNGDAERVKWDPSSGQLWNSIAREAKNKRVTVQRGGRLTRDAAAVIQGKERERDASGRIKKREWEKSWFHNKATEIGMTAAGLGGLATVRYANNNPDTKVGKAYTNTQASLRATKDGLADIGKNILGGITKITAKKALSAKLKKLRELDAIAEYEGWDVRDPRGRSARVFAPGSRKRERRQKEWHEKTENERKLWKAGIAAGVLGGAGAMLVGQRLVSGKSLIPSRFLKKKPIDPSKFADTPPSAKEADEILKNWNLKK